MMFALSNIGLCRQLLLVFSFLVISSCAYIIDNADASVIYAQDPGTSPWAQLSPTSSSYLTSANGTVVKMDFSRFQNQTLAFNNCNATSHCQVTMPFTGSGITIHGVLFAGVSNFTVAIDGELAPSPFLHAPVPGDSPPLYNITIYDLQSLTLGNHVMDITIVSWQSGESEIALDYFDINEAPPVPSASTAGTTSATPIPTYSGSTWSPYPSPVTATTRSKGVVIGAAVGGTIGGLVIIACIIAVVLLYLRRQKQKRLRPGSEIENQSKHISVFTGPPSPHLHEPYMAYTPYSTHTTAAPVPNLPQL